MFEIFNIIVLSTMAFISANTDGMIIAIAYLADPEYDNRNILYGQIIGFWLLTIVSFILAKLLFFIPKESTNWLGLIPIAFGLAKLLTYSHKDLNILPNIRSRGRQIQEMSLLTVATGADDVIAYTPIFATRKPHEITILFFTYTIMTIIWWLIAKWLANRKIVQKIAYKGGAALVSLLMITIGVIIISGD
jgi:cadmium resistance protein CadD (predicted permease)